MIHAYGKSMYEYCISQPIYHVSHTHYLLLCIPMLFTCRMQQWWRYMHCEACSGMPKHIYSAWCITWHKDMPQFSLRTCCHARICTLKIVSLPISAVTIYVPIFLFSILTMSAVQKEGVLHFHHVHTNSYTCVHQVLHRRNWIWPEREWHNHFHVWHVLIL